MRMNKWRCLTEWQVITVQHGCMAPESQRESVSSNIPDVRVVSAGRAIDL
jgi:hypothetical protein